MELALTEKKTIRLLVYENDDIYELSMRLLSFLNQHNLCEIHPDHQELFNRSLIYFIETKMQELGVPFKHSGLCYMSNTTPMPTIPKTDHLLISSGDNKNATSSNEDKDSGKPGFKMPNSSSLLD